MKFNRRLPYPTPCVKEPPPFPACQTHRPLFIPLIPAATASNQHKRHRRQQLTGRERLFRVSSENRMIF